MIDAIVVANESIGDAAEFEQAIPIGVVPRQARDFQTENDSHVSQRHFAGEASEPGAFVGAGAGEPEIFIDDDDLLFGPAELSRPDRPGRTGGRWIRGYARPGRAWTGERKRRRRAAVWVSLILEGSVIGLLLVLGCGPL